MKKLSIHFLFFVLIFQYVDLNGQNAVMPPGKHRVAIFTPLYLDSIFDIQQQYQLDKEVFPKFASPGLEFYEGAKLAMDSLGAEGAGVEFYIYDSESKRKTLDEQIQEAINNRVELFITQSSAQEAWKFAIAGKENKIPVINVNLPNNVGITNNPYFILLNSTLQTHCEGIYDYVANQHPGKPVVVFRKKGKMEDMLKSYFESYSNSNTKDKINIKYVDLPIVFSQSDILKHLDSTQSTVCLVGSLDDKFADRVIGYLSPVTETYPFTLIGMPTWDSRNYTAKQYKEMNIVYSTPFYNSRTDETSKYILKYFNKRIHSRPSDMAIRGFETTWKFSRLLLKYKKDIASNLSSREFNTVRNFDIQPVINKSTLTLDYFENKKLYFVKYSGGVLQGPY